MPEKRIKSPSDELIILPKEVKKHLSSAGKTELAVLIGIFADPCKSIAEVSRETGIPIGEAEKAYAFWRGAGIIVEEEVKTEHRYTSDTSSYRNYSSDDISTALEGRDEFRSLCDFAAARLGKILTKNDYSSLLYLYDFVAIPQAVICGVIEYCCSIDKKSMQYIFKKSVALFEDGIDSYEKFELYLAERERVNSDIGRIRRLIGAGERALTSKEDKMFENWLGVWRMPFDLIQLAFEKTIDNTGKFSVTYMNSILKRWFEGGVTTVEDVEKGSGSGSGFNGMASSINDDLIAAALAKGFDEMGEDE